MPNVDLGARPPIGPSQKTIRVKEIVADVRLGMTDSEIMKKYELSSKSLEKAFKKLLESSAISPFEFTQWETLFCKTSDLSHIRLFSRDGLDFYIPIFDTANPKVKGRVVNFSETGVSISGIEAKEGQIKTLVIPIKAGPVMFQGTCRWIRVPTSGEECVGGFEIGKILRGSWKKLSQLIATEVLRRQEQGKSSPPTTALAGLDDRSGEQLAKPSLRIADEEDGQARPAGIDLEATGKMPSVIKMVSATPPPSTVLEEEPTLEKIQACVDSGDYASLFTTGRNYLAFIMNPAHFAPLSSAERNEMLKNVKEKNAFMLTNLRKKARAFQLAIANSSLLVNP